MSYYQEARAHVKALKQMSEDNRRRQERRAELYEAQNEHPLHALRLDGRACKLYHNTEQYEAIERMEGLIPWKGGGGGQESLIDRFDGRAMLDMYIPHRPQPGRPKTEDELELEESVTFESFRDLVPLMQRCLSDQAGIAEAEKKNVEFRAAARAAAAAATNTGEKPDRNAAQEPPTIGNFGAVHFQYSVEGNQEQDSGGSASDDSGSDMELDEEDEEPEIEPQDGDKIARELGMPNFDVLLRRETKREESEGFMLKRARRKRNSKKAAISRAKRMAGQGLDPFAGNKKFLAPARWRQDQRLDVAMRGINRASPEYEEYRGSDQVVERHGFEERVEFITEFVVGEQSSSQVVPYTEDIDEGKVKRELPTTNPKGGIRDALPSQMDPSVEGPVALPSMGSTVHGIRAGEFRGLDREAQLERERRARERALERSKELGVGLSPRSRSPSEKAPKPDRGRPRRRSLSRGRSSSRSSSRDRRKGVTPPRSHRRSPSSSPSRSPRRRGGRRRSRSCSRSRDGHRERGQRQRSPSDNRHRGDGGRRHRRSPSWSRSRSRSRSRSHERPGPPTGSRGTQVMAASSGGQDKKDKGAMSAASEGGKKETPAERLKRIMAAQLNKQVQKDNLNSTQRKVQEERDRMAREQQQRKARGYDRGRDSPPRYR